MTITEVGEVEISAVLSNLVSSMSYTFDFTMSEVIENITVNPKVAGSDGVVTAYPDENFLIDIITARELFMYIATASGSHLRFV